MHFSTDDSSFLFNNYQIYLSNENIILDFIPNTFTFEKYINSFKTITHSLKQQNISIIKLKLWTNHISVEQIIALANALKINTTVKNSIIKSYEWQLFKIITKLLQIY